MSDFMRLYAPGPASSRGWQSLSFHPSPAFSPPSSVLLDRLQTQASSAQPWKDFRVSITSFLGMQLTLGSEPGTAVPGETFASPGCSSIWPGFWSNFYLVFCQDWILVLNPGSNGHETLLGLCQPLQMPGMLTRMNLMGLELPHPCPLNITQPSGARSLVSAPLPLVPLGDPRFVTSCSVRLTFPLLLPMACLCCSSLLPGKPLGCVRAPPNFPNSRLFSFALGMTTGYLRA